MMGASPCVRLLGTALLIGFLLKKLLGYLQQDTMLAHALAVASRLLILERVS
jgi:hypothetical protein